MNLLQRPSPGEGEWVSWNINGRAGAKLRLGPVFLGEISYPHDLGLGARWRAWLNHEHLGFFRNEPEARARIEAEIVRRFSLMRPAWSKFRRAHSKASPQRKATRSGPMDSPRPGASAGERRSIRFEAEIAGAATSIWRLVTAKNAIDHLHFTRETYFTLARHILGAPEKVGLRTGGEEMRIQPLPPTGAPQERGLEPV